MAQPPISEYEPNYMFSTRDLESERVKLTPFIPGLHSKELFEGMRDHPELFDYLFPYPYKNAGDPPEELIEKRMHQDPAAIAFAVFDKTGESPRLAGLIALVKTSVLHQCTEIGYIIILPEFQRTHVNTNAVGLLMHYCLDLPEDLAKGELKYGPGLGMRRVQWQCHADNATSVRAAERMGFKLEGVIRWDRILPEGKLGHAVSSERSEVFPGPGRHTCMLSVCWDDWELEGVREAVQKQMDRGN